MKNKFTELSTPVRLLVELLIVTFVSWIITWIPGVNFFEATTFSLMFMVIVEANVHQTVVDENLNGKLEHHVTAVRELLHGSVSNVNQEIARLNREMKLNLTGVRDPRLLSSLQTIVNECEEAARLRGSRELQEAMVASVDAFSRRFAHSGLRIRVSRQLRLKYAQATLSDRSITHVRAVAHKDFQNFMNDEYLRKHEAVLDTGDNWRVRRIYIVRNSLVEIESIRNLFDQQLAWRERGLELAIAYEGGNQTENRELLSRLEQRCRHPNSPSSALADEDLQSLMLAVTDVDSDLTIEHGRLSCIRADPGELKNLTEEDFDGEICEDTGVLQEAVNRFDSMWSQKCYRLNETVTSFDELTG